MTNEERRAMMRVEMRLAGVPIGYIKWLEEQCVDGGDFVLEGRARIEWWHSDDRLDRDWRRDVLRTYGSHSGD